jgi:two-component system chemotaxis response regulator CheB
MARDIVVIGASAGGVEALRVVIAGLPADFPGSLFIVIHTTSNSPGAMGDVLQRAGLLPVVTVETATAIRPGVIYVPTPDHHLIVDRGIVRSTSGPKENRFRPSVDPLFRSAAQSYRERVIGVILTGYLDDGTAGLWNVKQLGGTAMVQEPEDAFAPFMPRSALNHVEVDHCVRLVQIAPLLVRLTHDSVEQPNREVPEFMNIETDIAKERQALEAGVLKLGEPSNYACPECHGVLLQIREGDRVRFRCHTGHAYSTESLVAEMAEKIEGAVWNAIRALEENVVLLQQLAVSARECGDYALAENFLDRADEAQARADAVRGALPRTRTASEHD